MRAMTFFTCISVLGSSAPAFAADYSRSRNVVFNPPVVLLGMPAPKPIFLVASPPQYVMDLRTGHPGYWIIQQPSFLDRLFGERDGY